MDLNTDALHAFIKQALQEDVGNGDHTSISTIPQGQQGRAKLLVKDTGVLAGVSIALEIFKIVDSSLKVEVLISDGQHVQPNDIALYVDGSVHSILIAERLVLNTMQRMSGIATTTDQVVKLLEGTKTKVLDTRKTTPGLRYLEKLAVKIGGGVNHRFGLYDMILIKDNHVDYAGGTSKAIQAATSYLKDKNLDIPVEIEVRNLAEVKEALSCSGVDRILLDNFTFDKLKEAVDLIDGRLITEASGGITVENVREYALCGVNYVSMGALTHSVKSLDMSLKAVQSN
ncbi:MAG: carboxylating nicotinate-nucleotide diphosphorylase [Daejeonella sp.]|uniref:carboxylating nicotinate-nucleotide diphosphorylase n=1 Tax=Daejeonella sp. TaxID=2805397 RepID=UPI003C722BFB